MEQQRLYFIDAIRAWAILMMLQGHFIDGLLDPIYRDKEQLLFRTWLYFRGITAPVFFTASGLIFSYLLFKNIDPNYQKKRIKKGLKRALQLLVLGYALRLNMRGLFQGHIYPSFYYVDVLHCIGGALLGVMGLYYMVGKWSHKGFAVAALMLSIVIFVGEPAYDKLPWEGLPIWISHYITKAYGSVFTLIPWIGYSFFGAFLAQLLLYFSDKKHFYHGAIACCIVLGYVLKYHSSALFIELHEGLHAPIFKAVAYNNYLFIRLGDVLWVLAVFMATRKLWKHPKLLAIGQNTLSIYVFHAILLYGSFHGFGLYRFFKKSLDMPQAVGGAVVFVACCVWLSFAYIQLEPWRTRIAPWRTRFFSRIFKKN